MDPKEAIKEIEKEQTKVVNKNIIEQWEYYRILPLLKNIEKDLLEIMNVPKFLNQVKPFKHAINEPYNIENMNPIFIYKEKSMINNKGALIEGILHRNNKYFVYHFILDISIINNDKDYILHDIDIIAYKSSEHINDLFGKYIENKKKTRICLLTNDDTSSYCNPKDVISFEQMKKNLKKQERIYNKNSSAKCIGKNTIYRDECISEDPYTKQIGKWIV